MIKRFLQLEYTAIKRYGAKHWQAYRGSIAINTNYVVSCSQAEAMAEKVKNLLKGE